MNKLVIAVAAIAMAGTFGTAVAADADAGKAKYAVCAGCHGPTGAGNEALKYPKISGKDAGFIAQQLHDFKSGKRNTPQAATMKAMTAGLSDADIDNLAAYIATL
ncbi:MAG: c-type cytochrome [Gammaproteobacteria bacterium]|nr:c-type cytochrome [Gammaproteobacteria bacterium]